VDVATISPPAAPTTTPPAIVPVTTPPVTTPPVATPPVATPPVATAPVTGRAGDRSPASRRSSRRSELVRGRHEQGLRMFDRLTELRPDSREYRALRAELVEMHLPMVVYFARRYAGRGEPFDDLVQAGSLGLVKAVDRFDSSRGIAFSTFAGPTILGEIRRHFRDRTWAVHVHRSLQVLAGEVGGCLRDTRQELGRTPTVAELAVRMGLSEERVRESLQCAAAYRATSLSTPVGTDGTDGTLGDRLGGEDPAFTGVDLHESLGGMLARLPERERHILQLRFYGSMTQTQIAAKLGISQMHVSRLLKRTLARLRKELVEAE
jgi:RNA polymerase sigma-B factor